MDGCSEFSLAFISDKLAATLLFGLMLGCLGYFIEKVNSIKDKKMQRIRDVICVLVIVAIITVTVLGMVLGWFK